ncbi:MULTISPECIES: WxcM-like domain-containing protein [unclassified Rhizobacter]|uniref:WxcM-like domain-containing protein n=1 Tax=unclassified Rhizobacter TaxID=2640088 RepID=UPI0006FA8781|nr:MULTISPECIES: WxcM-like domain-containing protein [unclassified Rhizobacter]KQU74864.1 hypothetical protein ASC88_25945 [Rhizobacter sp. Root29]KQW01061.1 hypothetical protein ASC98_07020 [Rhizobacter sp. Root1238]KRB03911.1 hypothetical protein ASE08_14525 [Rhizobacter sp. Root16D2]
MPAFERSSTYIDPTARIHPSATVAADCEVGAGAWIGPEAIIGAGCKIGVSAYIGTRTRIAPGTVIGPLTAFVDVDADGRGTLVERDVVVGAHSTVLPGLTIGANCVISAGSVVSRSVPPAAVVEGSPASIVGYANTVAGLSAPVAFARKGTLTEDTPVKGVQIFHFPVIPDMRGNLTVGEFERQIPFIPRRYFMVFGVPSREVRGEHAHRECHQFLICMHGSCSVVADDGIKRVEIALDEPGKGLYLPPMTWGIQYKYSPEAMLMVFASHFYDAGDYIRDYDTFLDVVRRQSA